MGYPAQASGQAKKSDCMNPNQTASNPRAKENTQMKAMVLTKYGSADALELQEVAKPAPKDHQVLIKVQATALNAADHHLMKGALLVRLANGFRPKYPILGADVAGRGEAVVRYYGGVNLGAGGLVRAYGGTAAEALRIAERLEVHPRIRVSVQVGFEQMNALYKLLEDFDTTGREDEFTDQGLHVRWNALETEVESLRVAVRDATRGQGLVSKD
jgi:hypothetical protein